MEKVDSLSESVNPFTPESVSYGGTLPNAQVVDPTRRKAAAEQAGEGLNFDS
jgi:hypothetical protein